MLLYLSWSCQAANDSHLTNNLVLQNVHTTFVNVEELIKDHKIHVDSETFKVRHIVHTESQQECHPRKTKCETLAPPNDQVFPCWIFRS